MKEVKFVFDNDLAADHFLVWLCESGEQDYWQWMEYREQEESGDITAVEFDYHTGDGFGVGPVTAVCGRLKK